MKHSLIYSKVEYCGTPTSNRVQIYFFLLIPQNVNLLFRVTSELKKLIRQSSDTFTLHFAKHR